MLTSRRSLCVGVAAGAAAVFAVSGCGAASGTASGTGTGHALPSELASSSAASPSASTGPSRGGSPAPSQSAQQDDRARCTAAVLASLTTNQRAGQVLMVGVRAGSAASVVKTVKGYQVGGVFLRGRSSISAAALRTQVNAVQAASRAAVGLPVHVATDQEGGAVQVLSGAGFPRLPSALTQGTWNRSRLAAATTASAEALRSAGITLDLAPVADTVSAADASHNPPVGRYGREYAHTPDAVAADIDTVVTAMQGAGVGATAKHFPGLGRVRVNTDTGTGATDKATTPTDPNLRPFRAAVDAGVRAVMVSSASYPQLDADHLAAFSPAIITGLLRGDLGYTGLIMSDDLGSARAVAAVPVGRRAVRFIAAGGDLVLTINAAQTRAMRKALLEQVAASPTFRRRLDAAAGHVIASKIDSGMIHC